MFAFLALAGDLGCSAGPTIVGLVADACSNIQAGLLMAVLFPIMLFLGVLLTNIIGDGGEN